VITDVPVSEEIKDWAEVLAHRLELDLDTDTDLTECIRYETVVGRCVRIMILDRVLDILPVYRDAQGVWQIRKRGATHRLVERRFDGANKSWDI